MTTDVTSSRSRSRPPRRVVPPARVSEAPDANWLYLASSGFGLHVDDALAEPQRVVLLAADASWQFAYQDWASRRPRWWERRAWRAWRKEEAVLATQQDRIVRAALALYALRPQSSP